MARKKESMMEGIKKEEKSPLDLMWEAKRKAEEIAREDKTGTAWNPINPDLITPENLDLWAHLQNGELEIASGNLDAAREKLNKIKDAKARQSNEDLLKFVDNQIIEKIDAKRTAEDQAMDNY
jgi:hypothetical protein